jgi:hypothetical protein
MSFGMFKLLKSIFMKTKLYIFLAGLFAVLTACTEDEYTPPSDPAKAILGKWEIYQAHGSDYIITNPPGYTEYLSDSLIRWYDYETKEISYLEEKYWIDSLLHTKKKWMNPDLYITVDIYSAHSYEFYEDKMKLSPPPSDRSFYLVPPVYIYKRIK